MKFEEIESNTAVEIFWQYSNETFHHELGITQNNAMIYYCKFEGFNIKLHRIVKGKTDVKRLINGIFGMIGINVISVNLKDEFNKALKQLRQVKLDLVKDKNND